MGSYAAWLADIARRHPDGPHPKSLDLTRDDLVRLVVGLQWQTAVTLYAIAVEVDGGSMYGIAPRLLSRLPTACDFVDDTLRGK